jgi:hypothetical protein
MDTLNNAPASIASGNTTGGNHGVANLAALLNDRNGSLPVWIRAPRNGGPEHFTGLSRAKLYALGNERKIRSVSLREPGQIKGVRLWNLSSILDFIARCEAEANGASPTDSNPATSK